MNSYTTLKEGYRDINGTLRPAQYCRLRLDLIEKNEGVRLKKTLNKDIWWFSKDSLPCRMHEAEEKDRFGCNRYIFQVLYEGEWLNADSSKFDC